MRAGTALLVLGLLAAGPARAQATAPAASSVPEAADTAPPAGDPPAPAGSVVEPLPALTPPPPAVAAPIMLEPVRPVRHEPIYRKDWFWGAVGVVVITAAIVGAIALSNSDPATPSTRLGDMRAF